LGKEGNETGLVELKQQQGTMPNEEDAEEMLYLRSKSREAIAN
jgi:hypothetical protein